MTPDHVRYAEWDAAYVLVTWSRTYRAVTAERSTNWTPRWLGSVPDFTALPQSLPSPDTNTLYALIRADCSLSDRA